VLEHRYCDLRFCEFLETYPVMGAEAGLEVSFFEPANCWMYFYRNPGWDQNELDRLVENPDEDDQPQILCEQLEHVSLDIHVKQEDIDTAAWRLCDFKELDPRMTPARLSRYLAIFRNTVEALLVRLHTRKVDQRLLDTLTVSCAQQSFGSFAEKVLEKSPTLGSKSARMYLKLCQGRAKEIADAFGINVIWHDPDHVFIPETLWVDEDGYPIDPRNVIACSSAARALAPPSLHTCCCPTHARIRSTTSQLTPLGCYGQGNTW